MTGLVLTVENRHFDDCGLPPNLQNNSEHYVSFWQDSNFDQFVFVYEFGTEETYVLCGDAGWENKFPVCDFLSMLVCDTQTRLWIAACYSVVKREPITPDVLNTVLAFHF